MRFIDTLKEYITPGAAKVCYMDTDSFLLALTEDTLAECVRPELLQKWENEMVPKWFVNDAVFASQKEPGLLKEEASITSGWYIGLSPKCYIMTECQPSTFETRLLNPKNKSRIWDILDHYINFNRVNNNNDGNPVTVKRSAKGCSKKTVLR